MCEINRPYDLPIMAFDTSATGALATTCVVPVLTDVALYELEHAADDSTITTSLTYNSLADGCPSRDGAGVYVARAELRQPIQRASDDNCGQSQQLKLYTSTASVTMTPNPAIAVVEISLEGFEVDNTQLQVRDLLGRVVKQVSADGILHSLNVSSLPAGTYYLKASDGNSEETVQLIKIN